MMPITPSGMRGGGARRARGEWRCGGARGRARGGRRLQEGLARQTRQNGTHPGGVMGADAAAKGKAKMGAKPQRADGGGGGGADGGGVAAEAARASLEESRRLLDVALDVGVRARARERQPGGGGAVRGTRLMTTRACADAAPAAAAGARESRCAARAATVERCARVRASRSQRACAACGAASGLRARA